MTTNLVKLIECLSFFAEHSKNECHAGWTSEGQSFRQMSKHLREAVLRNGIDTYNSYLGDDGNSENDEYRRSKISVYKWMLNYGAETLMRRQQAISLLDSTDVKKVLEQIDGWEFTIPKVRNALAYDFTWSDSVGDDESQGISTDLFARHAEILRNFLESLHVAVNTTDSTSLNERQLKIVLSDRIFSTPLTRRQKAIEEICNGEVLKIAEIQAGLVVEYEIDAHEKTVRTDVITMVELGVLIRQGRYGVTKK